MAAACSPKLRPEAVKPVKQEVEKPVVKTPEIQSKPSKPAGAKVSAITLLLPFGLDHLKPGAQYAGASLKEADIALAYYRGFKQALDSLTASGYSFKLQVLDTKNHSFIYNSALKNAGLIVGPVFPEEIKAFLANYASSAQPIASPLSPSSPASYKNPALITMTPPLEYHAWAAARYINSEIKPKKVFILKSGFSDENDYIIPFKKAIDSLSKSHIKAVGVTVLHGQLNSIIPQLSQSGQNVFVVPSLNQHFLNVTLHKLDSLSSIYPIIVFGHPNWINFSFLKTDMLERLHTHITSADRVDYKADNTLTFIRNYRSAYHTEPTEYAIKGFDDGLYLGQRLASDSLKNLSQAGFTGLHNSFQFQKKTGLGWINTHVYLLKYANFELEKVE